MQTRILSMAAMAATLSTGALMSSPAGAIALGGADAARTAAERIDPVEKAACWRWGRHGWDWYEVCRPGRAAYVEEDVVERCRDVTVREHRGGETIVRRIHRCD